MSGGVAELADRPVDPRRVARWMAAFGLLAALGLLASDEALPMRHSNFITGIERMPVRFTPSAPEPLAAEPILLKDQLR